MSENSFAQGINGFDRFLAELQGASPDMDYVWTKEKERSCNWILSKITSGVGVDVGGTHYIQQKLQEKGCRTFLYDQNVDSSQPDCIRDDMINILDHFGPESLDFITTRHTLEHAIVPMFQLWAYNRILKPDGQLFVIVPSHSKIWVWFGTHHNCLPYDNWQMLFYRTGFRIKRADAGTWRASSPNFIEWRFELVKESDQLRMEDRPGRRANSAKATEG